MTVDYTTTETVGSGDSDDSESANSTDDTKPASAESAAENTSETADTGETETETEAETVKVAKQVVLHIGSQNDDGDYYAAMDGSKEVHVISADTIKELIEKKASDFIDNEILSGTLSNAKSIDVTIGSDSWHLAKEEVAKADDTADSAETEGTDSEKAAETTDAAADETTADAEKVDESETETETEEKWYGGDKEIALTDLSSVYSDLSGMSAEKILDTAEKPTGDAAISVTVKWEDDTETTVSFTAYDLSLIHISEPTRH